MQCTLYYILWRRLLWLYCYVWLSKWLTDEPPILLSSEGLPVFQPLCASLCCDDLLEHNRQLLFPPHLWSLFTVIITQPLTLSHERKKRYSAASLYCFFNFFCLLPLSSSKNSIIARQRHTQDLWDYQAVSLAGVQPSPSPRGWALKSSMVPPDKAFPEVELAFFLVGPWNQLCFNLFGIEWKAHHKSNLLHSDGSDWPLDE